MVRIRDMTDGGVSLLDVMLHVWLLDVMSLGHLVMQNWCLMVHCKLLVMSGGGDW